MCISGIGLDRARDKGTGACGFHQGENQGWPRVRKPVTIHCEEETEDTVLQELHISEKPDGNDGPHGITHAIITEGGTQPITRDRCY